MEPVTDVRYVALPGMLVAGILQYLRFAKKPMAAPCQRVTESVSRRCVLIGLLLELLTLRLLPLCQAYPMNASLVVVLYFWRESKAKRGGSSSSISSILGEFLVCTAALSPWLLPFLDSAEGKLLDVLEVEMAAKVVLSPVSCAYVVLMLFLGIVLYCRNVGEGAFWCCAAPALNFGFSALLLKTLIVVVVALAQSPATPELWAGFVILLGFSMGVRNAAAGPLRRALEVYDNLSVLAFYGLLSGCSAATTGCFVFGEMAGWDPLSQAVYFPVVAAHCWGMHRLGARLDSGASARRDDDKYDEEMATTRDRAKLPPGGATSAKQSTQELKTFSSRGSHAAGLINAAHVAPATSSSPHRWPESGECAEKDEPVQLLPLDEGPARHTVEEDAEIEDKFFAKALDAQNLTAVDEGDSVGWADFGEVHQAAPQARPQPPLAAAADVHHIASPQFDADFDEIMRRFDEDDKRLQETRDVDASDDPLRLCEEIDNPWMDESTLPETAPATQAEPLVVAFDADTLLDIADTGQDDEDELLKGIEDVDGP